MTDEPPASEGLKPQESLSQLIAKVLDQLSISAWLPAGALVFIVLFFATLRHSHGDLEGAMETIGTLNFSSLFLLLGTVVLVTMIIQAFEFEAVRLLEGYWGPGRLATRLANARCERHVERRDRLDAEKQKLGNTAFGYARQKLLDKPNVKEVWVNILEADRHGRVVNASEDDHARARDLDWREQAAAPDIRRIDEITDRLREFPALSYRVRPTLLGNTIRAYEDRAYTPQSGSLEGMVMRVFHRLPIPLQSEHDQYRSRLELYCAMFVVLVLAATTAFPALLIRSDVGWEVPTAVVPIALLLSGMSYRAAIASARGYGTALEEIGHFVDEGGPEEE